MPAPGCRRNIRSSRRRTIPIAKVRLRATLALESVTTISSGDPKSRIESESSVPTAHIKRAGAALSPPRVSPWLAYIARPKVPCALIVGARGRCVTWERSGRFSL